MYVHACYLRSTDIQYFAGCNTIERRDDRARIKQVSLFYISKLNTNVNTSPIDNLLLFRY